MFSFPNPPSYIWQERERERERDVQVLDLKGLVNEYLGTQNLDTYKALNLSWRLARCKIWFENEIFESPLETCREI
jgi:hypothetical protein